MLQHFQHKPSDVATLHPTNDTAISKSPNNKIFHQSSPGLEPTTLSAPNFILGRQFSICIQQRKHEMIFYSVSNMDILCCYGIPVNYLITNIDFPSLTF